MNTNNQAGKTVSAKKVTEYLTQEGAKRILAGNRRLASPMERVRLRIYRLATLMGGMVWRWGTRRYVNLNSTIFIEKKVNTLSEFLSDHKEMVETRPREDFDYTCECGYYECEECSAVAYPMEVEPDPDTGEYNCYECGGRMKLISAREE